MAKPKSGAEIPRAKDIAETKHAEQKQTCDMSIAEKRRIEILDAASRCFIEDGFHRTSISKISAAAGMSAGHIYHFFPNKEAIVVGIVERQLDEWFELLAPYRSEDVNRELVERIYDALERRTRPDFIALWHEVLAETSRNPNVGPGVRQVDKIIRKRVVELVAVVREARGVKTATSLEAITEVSLALFEGLSNRATLNPKLNNNEIRQVLVAATIAVMDA